MLTNERITNQKEIILKSLRSVRTHPSAEVVYKLVKKKLPRISLATVYRNLENFRKKGEVLKLEWKNTSYFDGFTHPHAHLFCTNCGSIIDVERFNLQSIEKKIKKLNFKIKSYSLNFIGLCDKCHKRQ